MTDNIDELLKSLEDMIEAKDEMWHEDQYANYREVLKIREDRYNPAKKKARQAIEAVIKETVREMFRNRIRHKL